MASTTSEVLAAHGISLAKKLSASGVVALRAEYRPNELGQGGGHAAVEARPAVRRPPEYGRRAIRRVRRAIRLTGLSLQHAATYTVRVAPRDRANNLADCSQITQPVTILANAPAFSLTKNGTAGPVLDVGLDHDALAWSLRSKGLDAVRGVDRTGKDLRWIHARRYPFQREF